MKKIAALVMIACTMFIIASCSKSEEQATEPTTAEQTTSTTTTSAPVTAAPSTELSVTAATAAPETTAIPETTTAATTAAATTAPATSETQQSTETTAAVTQAAATTAPVEVQSTAAAKEMPEIFKGIKQFDFNSVDYDPANWTKEQIIQCYQSGMAMEDHNGVQTDQSFELVGDLPGKAAILKQPVKLAMKLAAQPFEALPGGYWDIVPSDIKSADAHRDGDYVVINLYPENQTDGPNGNEHEGTVGHVVNVVQGIDGFIAYVEENFSVLNAKYDDDSVVLQYSEAYAKDVRINTKTGKMESANWGYLIDIYLDHCSMAGVNFEDFHTTIRWKCWYPVTD